MDDKPRAPIASQRHPRLFASASKTAERAVEIRLLGWSHKAAPTIKCRVILPDLVADVCERCRWATRSMAVPEPVPESAEATLATLELSKRGVYGALYVALCHAWALAYPPSDFLGRSYEGIVPEDTSGDRKGLRSFSEAYKK